MNWESQQLETLKDLDQWVVWGYYCRDRDCRTEIDASLDECPDCGSDKSKPPIAPFDRTRHARSNDSETWGSYETAVEYHNRDDTHTEGIGFMLSEDDLIVGIDLDGCRHPETGALEPWAEQIVEHADTYTEVSPSETGLRLFAVGILPDGRNKQKQDRTLDLPEWVLEEKNAEVEMYDDVRYMTYTGNQVEGTPDDVEKRASAVKEIHAEYVASDNDDGGSTSSPEQIDVSGDGDESGEYTNKFGTSLGQIREWDEKLDELLKRLEPSFSLPSDDDSASGYDYSAVMKLLYWQFSETDIARILRRYRGREKLKRDDYLKTTIANAKGDLSETCDPPQNRNMTENVEPSEAKVALDAMLSLYEDDPDRDMKHWSKIWEAAGKLEDDDIDEIAPRVADVLDVPEGLVSRHSERVAHEEENGPIVVENGKTWYLAGEPRQRYELLNFELDVKSYLKVERGPLRAELEAALSDGESFTKAIEPKIFNKKERFDDEVLAESFGTKFNIPQIGDSAPYVQDLLDALRMWVHRQDAPKRLGVRHMGLYGGEFAIPGHTLRSDGWTDDPETVYLEREIGPERRVDMPTDRDEYDADDVAQIVETLPYTREMERLLPVLGWFYAAPLRSVVEDFTESGEFNHLNITGDTGSGKTTTLGYIWRCFGMAGEPFSVGSSAYAQLATFSSTNTIPLWFDEYKPSDIPQYKLDRFHDKFRKATRGAFAERGNTDRSTDSYKIQAPCVVSGEQSIQGPAERRRSIMTQFRSDTTDPGTETAETYKELVGQARIDGGELEVADDAPAPSDHALAYYRFATDADSGRLKDLWYSSLEYAHELVNEMDVLEEMDDLEIQGLQTVVFGFKVYREFAEEIGADTSKLPTTDDLDTALEYVVERIGPAGKRKSHTDRFVEIFGRAVVADYLERGEQYELVHEGTPREEVRINLPRAFDKISKYAKDHDIQSEDLLNDHSDYRDRFRELADQPGAYVSAVQQYTPGVSKCTGISTVKAMNQLDFDRSVLGDDLQPIEGDETDGEGSEDDGGGPGVSASETQTNAQAAATDGGKTAGAGSADVDVENAKGRVDQLIRNTCRPGDEVTVSRISGELNGDIAPEDVRMALEKLADQGVVISESGDGKYSLA